MKWEWVFWTTAAYLLSYICVLNTVEWMLRLWSLITVIRCGLGLTSRWREHGETQLWVFTVGAGWLVGGKFRGLGCSKESHLLRHADSVDQSTQHTIHGNRWETVTVHGWIVLRTSARTLHPHSNTQTTRQHWKQFKLLHFYGVSGTV